MALGVGCMKPRELRYAEHPSEFMGNNHRWKNTASACPQLGRPTSKGTAKSAQAFWPLDLAQSWTVSVPAGKGPGFSSSTKAPTRLWEPLGCQAERFTRGPHEVPRHWASPAARALPARLREPDRNRLCWAVALMALATRGQQVHTGSPARGHLRLHQI